jgi:PST family polysaccharide transporter
MVTAHEFIRVMLSAKWEPAIPIFLVLVPVGLVQTMISPTGHLYISTGRSDLYFKVGLLSNILNITAFLIGIHWGAMGVAIAYLITSYVVALPLLKIGFSLIDLSLAEYAKWIAPQLGIGLGMAAVAFSWKQGMKALGLSDPLFLLVTTSTVGALFYCILLFRIRPAGVQELLGYADRFPIARRIIGVLGGQPA